MIECPLFAFNFVNEIGLHIDYIDFAEEDQLKFAHIDLSQIH